MTAADFSTTGYILKQTYTDERKIFNAASRDRILLSKVKKRKFAKGAQFNPALIYANPQGITNTYASLATNETPTSGIQWAITTSEKHGRFNIGSKFMHESMGAAASYVDAVENEMDAHLDEFGARLGQDLYGDGTGGIGVITNTVFTGAVATLSRKSDVRNFAKGKIIQFFDPVGLTLRDAGDTLIVASIDEDAGTVTFTTILSNIAGIATNDGMVNNGDFNIAIKGLAAWIPLTTPSATLFFGQNRTLDPKSFAGNRLNTPTAGWEDIILTLGAMIYSAGGRPDAFLVNPLRWADLAKTQASRIVVEPGTEPTVGFQYIPMATPGGMCRVYPDPSNTTDLGWMVEWSAFEVIYAGPGLPHVNRDDGLWARKQGDGLEVHTRAYWQMWFKKPSHCGVAALPT